MFGCTLVVYQLCSFIFSRVELFIQNPLQLRAQDNRIGRKLHKFANDPVIQLLAARGSE